MTTTNNDSIAKWSDQYKDPRWQKKRLEVLSIDEWMCQKCGSKDKALHVHHASYVRGRKIWEYSASEMVTLCDQCHKTIHNLLADNKEVVVPDLINSVRSDGEFDYFDMLDLMSAIAFEGDIYKNVCLELVKQYRKDLEAEREAVRSV